MLKIKSFLLSFSLSPLFLTSLQLPSQAQTTTPTFPSSKGAAGFASGVNPTITNGISIVLKELTIEQVSRLRESALSRLQELKGASRDLLIEPRMSIDSRDRAINLLGDITIAVLGVGGTKAQAEIASSLINSGGDRTRVLVLIQAISGLFRSKSIGRVKSVDSAKEFTVAQASDQELVDIDTVQLDESIQAYNDLVNTSSPEVVSALSKNEEFISIGKTLRELRDSVR